MSVFCLSSNYSADHIVLLSKSYRDCFPCCWLSQQQWQCQQSWQQRPKGRPLEQPYFFIESSVRVSAETHTDGPLFGVYLAVLLSVGTRMPPFLLRCFCLASLSGKSEGFPDNLRFHSTLSVKPYGYPDGSAWEGCPIGAGMTENIRGMLSVLHNRE